MKSERYYVEIRRCKIPIYEYLHPETGEIFDDLRSYKDANKPFIAPDGVKCIRQEIPSRFGGWKEGREVFELDSDFAKKIKPKYVKFRDGHRERYDSTKHC